jgi:4-hydroxybenzoate polyprenyltransferase
MQERSSRGVRSTLNLGSCGTSDQSPTFLPSRPSFLPQSCTGEPLLSAIAKTLRAIKIEHTLFALPFALISMLIASGGHPPPRVVLWILVAMVGARSAAMAFNRLVDQRIDARNPRTRQRELPTGQLSRGPVWLFTLVMSALLVVAAWQLNPLCLKLSPLALAVIFLYSFSKRFTTLTHFLLGLSLALAPIGARIAVTGGLARFPLWLGGGVILWVAGFDIIYGCQDTAFDRAEGLHSVSAALGDQHALTIARVCHLGFLLCLWFAGRTQGMGALWIAGLGAIALLLSYEQWLVRGGDLRKIDRAFFEVNSWVGITMLVFVLGEIYLL